MACLYCGKDIGPFRLLRDDEFCSEAHRKRYVECLGRAIHRMVEPEPAPAGVAGFRISQDPAAGSFHPVLHEKFLSSTQSISFENLWSFEIPSPLGSDFVVCTCVPAAAPDLNFSRKFADEFLEIRLPQWDAQTFRPEALSREWTAPPAVDIAPVTPEAARHDVEVAPVAREVVPDAAAIAAKPTATPAPRRSDRWMPVPSCPAAREVRVCDAAEPLQPAAALSALQWTMEVRSAAMPSLRLEPVPLVREAVSTPATPLDMVAVIRLSAPAMQLPQFALSAIGSAAALMPSDRAIPMPASTGTSAQMVTAAPPLLRDPRPAQLPAFAVGAGAESAASAAPPYCEQPLAIPSGRPMPGAALPLHADSSWKDVRQHRPRLPEVRIEVAESDLLAAMPIPQPWDWPMAGLRAEAVAREVQPAAAATVACGIELVMPHMAASAASVPTLQAETELLEPPPALPAAMLVEPRWNPAAALLELPSVALGIPAMPALPALRPIFAELVAPSLGPMEMPAAAAASAAPVVIGGGHAPQLPSTVAASPAGSLTDGAPAPYEQPPLAFSIPEAAVADTCPGTPVPLRLPGFAGIPTAGLPADIPGFTLVPRPVESLPTAEAAVPAPAAKPLDLALPQFNLESWREFSMAGFGSPSVRAATPEPREPNKKVAVLRRVGTIRLAIPKSEPRWPNANIPRPGLMPLDFHCQRNAAKPSLQLEWNPSELPLVAPEFNFTLVADRTDEPPATKPVSKPRAEVVSMPDAAKRRRNNRAIIRAAQIAACLLVALALWVGGRVVTEDDSTAASNRTLARGEQPAAKQPLAPTAKPAVPPAPPQEGMLARVQHAIANRAAAEVGDTLRNGMESWGAQAKSWAPGWSRHPDGYTHPGDLALFRPSMAYTNYRLDFFGQIETKGMGWVVRAHDSENYYAMKFKVVEAGLRPVIALVHYPVIAGRKGHTVETTLSAMVHKNTPFLVSVDVSGNRLTASIEGQNIDSWTDDLLYKGGVGFFSEAGERSRLYWMRVSKNQDWIGHICSFLAGSEKTQKAELWPAGPPGATQPDLPAYMADIILAEAEDSRNKLGRPLRARIWNLGRIGSWG